MNGGHLPTWLKKKSARKADTIFNSLETLHQHNLKKKYRRLLSKRGISEAECSSATVLVRAIACADGGVAADRVQHRGWGAGVALFKMWFHVGSCSSAAYRQASGSEGKPTRFVKMLIIFSGPVQITENIKADKPGLICFSVLFCYITACRAQPRHWFAVSGAAGLLLWVLHCSHMCLLCIHIQALQIAAPGFGAFTGDLCMMEILIPPANNFNTAVSWLILGSHA